MLETPRQAWLRRLLPGFRAPPLAMSRLRTLFRAIEADRGVPGVLVQIDGLNAGWATRSALRDGLSRLRASGKRVVVYLPDGGDQAALFVASCADTVWVAPPAIVTYLGPMAARTYIKPLLDRIGVDVEVLAQGDYKSAADPLARTAMSERDREQLTALVATLSDNLTAAVASRPNLDADGARRLLGQAVFSAAQAVEVGLADAALYDDEVHRALGFGPGRQPIPAGRYLALRPRPLWRPLRARSQVAILRLEGAIGAGMAARGIDQRATTTVLRQLAADRHVAGVILYIDSPGGSAVTSDLLHREVLQLSAQKPVVAWLGNIAASGGYYLAVAASKIVAQPSSITGSIGVISVRPVIGRLLAEIGLNREVVKQADHADIHDVARALSAFERAALEAETQHVYARFLAVVAEGRAQTVDTIRALAGGRVWSGRDAHRHGLVDALGGYDEARAALDQLLASRGIVAAEEPIIVAAPRRDVAPPPPAQHALDALCRVLPELLPARDLLAFALGRQRTLCYAHDLPEPGWRL